MVGLVPLHHEVLAYTHGCTTSTARICPLVSSPSSTRDMLAIAPYAAAALVVGLGATSIARRCVRASSVRASCAHGLDALESRLRGCAREDVVLLIDFDRTITDGTSAQCHDVVGATECMPLRVREGFAKMLDFSQPFPPELEVVLSGFNQYPDTWPDPGPHAEQTR